MITVKEMIKQLLDNSLTVNDHVKIDGSVPQHFDEFFEIKKDKGYTLFIKRPTKKEN